MRFVLASLAIITSTVFGNGELTAQTDSDQRLTIEQLLPDGEVEFEFLDVGMSERGLALAEKLRLNTDSQWLQEYIATVAKPGEALPYHTNLGLTESEFQEFLVASAKMKIRPVGVNWRCRLARHDRTVTLEPIGRNAGRLSSIEFNLDTTIAKASGVDLGASEWRSRPSADGAIGPWRGYLWSVESGDPETFATGGDLRVVKLDLLHIIGTDYVYLRHKFAERTNGGTPISKEFMLRFVVPGIGDTREDPSNQ